VKLKINPAENIVFDHAKERAIKEIGEILRDKCDGLYCEALFARLQERFAKTEP
jgi:hypothetical protein